MYGNTESSRARVPLIEIPVISSIAAGSPLEVVDDDEPHETIHIPANKLNMPPPYYAFRVNGESMYPYIWDGDIVILSRDWRGNKINGRICGFRTPDGITLKRLVLQPKQKTSWLMPLNPTYNPTPYNKDTEELALFGVLVLSIREYK
jgi:SOS-response transcriptional repressor LexA